MSDDLPRRPMQPLSPPPGGLADVRARARRRRTSHAVTAGVATAAILGVVSVATLTNGARHGDGLDQLHPAHQISASTSVEPSPSGSPSAEPAARPSASPSTATTVGGAAPSAPVPSPSPDVHGAARYTTPPIALSYRPDTTKTNQPAICQGASSDDNAAVHQKLGWCLRAKVTPSPAGHDLNLEVCRDSTGSGTLNFPSSLEADLSISSGSRIVWRWSADHPASASPHARPTATSYCWDWKVAWTDVDQQGRALGHGSYVLSGLSNADELKALNHTETSFTI